MPNGAFFNEGLLYDVVEVMKGLHQVVIDDHNGGYHVPDPDHFEWFEQVGLVPVMINRLETVPQDHTGKVYCWIFDLEDSNSNYFFEDANMAILFKLTFGGR